MDVINSINGVELSDIDSLYKALSHLDKDYNDGKINFDVDGERLRIRFGSRIVPTGMWDQINSCPHLVVTVVGCDENKAFIEVRDA